MAVVCGAGPLSGGVHANDGLLDMLDMGRSGGFGRQSAEADLGPAGPAPLCLLIPLNTARQPQSPTTMGPMDLNIHI